MTSEIGASPIVPTVIASEIGKMIKKEYEHLRALSGLWPLVATAVIGHIGLALSARFLLP